MVSTKSWYYCSSSPNHPESVSTLDFGPRLDTDKAFELVLALDTDPRLQVWRVGTVDDIDDDLRHVAENRFSRRAGGISLPDWQLQFQTWRKEKHQRTTSFNNWYAFELLPQNLELEAL